MSTQAILLDAPAPSTSAIAGPVAVGNAATDLPATSAMLRFIEGFWVSRAIQVAATLGLADALAGGPRSAAELSLATETHAPTLYRLLRALAGTGVFTESEDGHFGLTPVGATLRSDVPGSLRHFAISELGLDHYQAWELLLESVHTGEDAFRRRFGMPIWEYYAEHAENGEVFNRSLVGATEIIEPSILDSYDFSRFRIVMDVGGGYGTLLTAILQRHPRMWGALLELPAVAAVAEQKIAATGIGARFGIVPGDFFEGVPAGADAYLLKWILHDWDDERAIRVLANCRHAIGEDGRVLVIEGMVAPPNEPSYTKWLDLNMLVMTGGKERTAAEFADLFEAAGLRLAPVVPTSSGLYVLEGVRA